MRIKITLLLLLISLYIFPQSGSGPATNCAFPIPEICLGGSYPASTSGTATAPGASFACPGTSPIVGQPAFFFFEVGTSGQIDLQIDPVDPITGQLLTNDLDFIAWGPFNNTANMCSQLQAVNNIDCSYSANSSETINITGANIGDFYVILVSNWDANGTPSACNISFSADTTFGGLSNPFTGGGFAGDNNTINPCGTDPPFDLITGLNNQPDNNGYWTNSSGNIVNNIFDPSINSAGIYTYIIPGSTNCPGDTAFLTINLVNGNNVSITSPSLFCTGDQPLTLTASPPGGVFSGNNVINNTFTANASSVGINQITYVYSANGCADTAYQNITVNESPTVLPNDIITINPACFGESTGSVIISASSGQTPYTYNWYGENPLALPSGVFNYTVTDDNGCTYSDNVTLYDPQNTLASLTSYNSSCYAENDGSISVVMNGGSGIINPDDTISTLNYCASNPNFNLITPSAIIEEVILNGDNNNINNNTSGIADFYENYTSLMYADITQGQSYTVNVTLNGIGGFGNSINNSGAKVYIDFNIDGDFTDVGEEIGIIPYRTNATIGTPSSINFTVPITGATGATRMRVVSQYRNPAPSNVNDLNFIGPCDAPFGFLQPWYGATEDYTVVLNSAAITADFNWSNGVLTNNASSDSITNLAPGTYTVIITPSNGCPVQDSATILEPSPITFNPIITNVSCNSFNDGTITLNPAGGENGPYSEDWGIINPNSLTQGLYSVIVTDIPSGCSNDTIIAIDEPNPFNVDFSVSSNEICLGDPVTLNFNFNQGGSSPFIVNYTENGNAQTVGPFMPGQHQVNIAPLLGNNVYIITDITDINGCVNQNNINSEFIYVNPIPDIEILIAPNPICAGDNSNITFTSPSGSPPYLVDFTEGSNPTSINVSAAGANLPVSPINTTTYTLNFVTDNKGCTANLSDSATLIVNSLPELIISSPPEVCDNEMVQLQFNFSAGDAPWLVNYDVNGSPTSVLMNNINDSIAISVNSTINYTINSVSDNNGCVSNLNQTVIINTNPLPEISLSGGGSICNDGSISDIIFTINSGTPPYNLQYYAGLVSNFVPNISNIYTIQTNQSGTYTIGSLIDAKGCEASIINGSASVNINPLPEANISAYPQPANILDPLIYFNDLSNGHSSGVWDFGDGNIQITNFGEINHLYSDTGIYQTTLTITSDSGCTDVAYQNIIISPVFTIYIPNSFTPNKDLKNDYFLPVVTGVNEYEFSIYDRLGKRLFRTNKTDLGWDGKIDESNEYATTGIYIYSLIIKDINGKIRNYEGQVTLIR